jgi:hypothetical protein
MSKISSYNPLLFHFTNGLFSNWWTILQKILGFYISHQSLCWKHLKSPSIRNELRRYWSDNLTTTTCIAGLLFFRDDCRFFERSRDSYERGETFRNPGVVYNRLRASWLDRPVKNTLISMVKRETTTKQTVAKWKENYLKECKSVNRQHEYLRSRLGGISSGIRELPRNPRRKSE